ncbi:hypothetical protein [Ferrovibrio sp.]|uniref:hypothetical protein n=1 Tax=Ferrovibrio sp. TaxID=1917215 RepID=UPI0035B1A886
MSALKNSATEAGSFVAPEALEIEHTNVDGVHVFTSADLPGFHVGHPDLKTAYEMIVPAVEKLVKLNTGEVIRYRAETTLEEFIRMLEPNPNNVVNLDDFRPKIHVRPKAIAA